MGCGPGQLPGAAVPRFKGGGGSGIHFHFDDHSFITGDCAGENTGKHGSSEEGAGRNIKRESNYSNLFKRNSK